jgi:membrane protease YdiL (CAAX protease family)
VLSGYNGGGDVRFEILSFAIGVVAISGPMTWLRLRSGSLWPCAVLHASHNLFVQGVFDRLTTRGDGAITVVGEFGVVFAGSLLLVSLPFWTMGMRRG